jgi:PIN domain nuclease of toxin-antitoxin system
LPDALVLATAQVDAADVILTADRSWRRIDARVQVI